MATPLLPLTPTPTAPALRPTADERIATLERRQRRFAAALLAFAVLSAGLGFSAGRANIDASAFRLLGDNDTPRATLALGPDGSPALTFYDDSGKALRALGARDDTRERLAKVEDALAALQRHVLLQDTQAGVAGPVFGGRPDVVDDLQRDQTQRDVERVQEDLRRRQRELELESDIRRRQMDDIRRDLERRQRELSKP